MDTVRRGRESFLEKKVPRVPGKGKREFRVYGKKSQAHPKAIRTLELMSHAILRTLF